MSDDAEGRHRLVLRCAWCDRMRDEQGAWQVVRQERLRAMEDRLTHGMCPQCFAELTNGDELPGVAGLEN